MNNNSKPLFIVGFIFIMVSGLLTVFLRLVGFPPSIWKVLLPLGLVVIGVVSLIKGKFSGEGGNLKINIIVPFVLIVILLVLVGLEPLFREWYMSVT